MYENALTDILYCLVPLAVFQLLLFLTVKRRKSTFTSEFALFLLGISVAAVLTLTGVAPMGGLHGSIDWSSVNTIPFTSIVNALKSGDTWFALTNIGGNILFFVPLGLLSPLLWQGQRKLWRTAGRGLLFSLLIEFAQLFSSRSTDINDLILNTLGAIVGYLLFRLFHCIAPRTTAACLDNSSRRFAPFIFWCLAIICFVTLLGVNSVRWHNYLNG